jgi:hypothetical protein
MEIAVRKDPEDSTVRDDLKMLAVVFGLATAGVTSFLVVAGLEELQTTGHITLSSTKPPLEPGKM